MELEMTFDYVSFKSGTRIRVIHVVHHTEPVTFDSVDILNNRLVPRFYAFSRDFKIIKNKIRQDNGKTQCACGRWYKRDCPKRCNQFMMRKE